MHLILSLTHRCNLRCAYCYAGRSMARAMPLSVACKALDYAFRSPDPAVNLTFFGGEPLLEPDLIDAIAQQAQARAATSGKTLRMGLTTNGTLLSRHMDLLCRHGLIVTVSLDGDRDVHDATRVWPNGGGSWQAAQAGLGEAMARGLAVRTVSVAHPGNADRLGASFDAVAALGHSRLVFNFDYSAPWDDASLSRCEAGLESLADRALARYRAGHDFSVQPLHAKIVSQLKGGFCATDRCRFGCAEIAVAPSGALYPCDRLIGEDDPARRELVIGHVDTGVDAQRVQALRGRKDTPNLDCEGCALIDRCMWWCGCANHARTGHTDRVDETLCRIEQATIRAADRLASTLFGEGNRPFMRRYYLAAADSGSA